MAQPLDPHIEGTLLRILQDVKQNPQDAKQNNDDVQSPRGRRFKEICDSLRDDDGLVFGKKGSELRRRVQRRRDHLLRYPGALQAALEAALKRELELPQPKSSPPTKITPAPAVSSIMPTGNNNNESFRLHFDESWGNPDGIFSLMAPNVKVGDRIVDKVRLLIPFHDVEDVPLFKARLSEDGSSFILTKPTIPGYLRDRENIEAITQYVDRSVGVACEQCKNLYEVQSTTMEMEENAHLRTKDTTYKFPDGITCNNDTFNLGQNGEKPTDAYSLRIRVNMDLTQLGEIASADENPKMAYGVHPFMAIEMAVDDIDAKVRRTKKVSEEEVNSVDEAFMNFGITRTPNRNRRGGGTVRQRPDPPQELEASTSLPPPPPSTEERSNRKRSKDQDDEDQDGDDDDDDDEDQGSSQMVVYAARAHELIRSGRVRKSRRVVKALRPGAPE